MTKTPNYEKTILITGCSTGIGLDAAIELKERHYNVIASARKFDDVQRLKNQGLQAIQLDLANSASIAKAVEEALIIGQGKIDALFNNAAFGQPGAVEDISRDLLRQQFEANLFGTHELTNLIIPVMRRQGHGRIIYTGSLLGLVALKYRGAYISSKFALEGLVDTLRLELHGSGIHLSLIEPGPILTNFRNNQLSIYLKVIDTVNSHHHSAYQSMEHRLGKKGAAVAFTLPPSAVTKKLIRALEVTRPKPRYYVTLPTYFFAFLKAALPTFLLDAVLRKF